MTRTSVQDRGIDMMGIQARIGWATALLLLCLAAGLYLSGFLTLLLLGVDSPLEWDTYLKYVQALDLPQARPHAWKIKLSGVVGLGVVFLAWLPFAVILLKPRHKSVHGEARFANRGDLSKLGLLKDDPTGLIIGRYKGALIRMTGTRHALLAAPTRSGKGVGAVIPNLLNFPGSLVVLDIKQEGFDITSGYRAGLGPVFLFNPFAEDLRTHRWNPLSYVSLDPIHRTGHLQAIADCLYKESPGQDPFWARMSRSTFVAAASYLFDLYADDMRNAGSLPGVERAPFPTLGAIYRLLSGDGSDLKQQLQLMMRQPFVAADTRTKFAGITGLAEQTFTSVIATTQAPLLMFANPILDAATSGNDFLLTDLRRQVQTIYVGISPSKLSEANTLLNLFFEQAIKLNGSVLPEQDKTLKHQCLFLLDEFAALGRVDILVDGVSWLAGYNVRVFCVIQSPSQLEAVYGAEKSRSMITNLACQVVYTPREQRDANEYSEMLGFTTVRRKQRTRSHGSQGSISFTEVEEKVELMKPQELKAMSPDKEIIFIEGMAHPIMADKIRYYKDGYFTARLKPKVVISKLRLELT